VVRCVLQILQFLDIQWWHVGCQGHGDGAALEQLQLTQPFLQPLAAAAQ
jgi:hypothetical protein